MVLTPVICGSCKATAEVNLLTTAACGNCGSDDLDFFEGAAKPEYTGGFEGEAAEHHRRGLEDALADRDRDATGSVAYGRGYDAGLGFRHPITDEQRRINTERFGRERHSSVHQAAATPYGEVRVWADGFGTWHASVALDDHSINAAQKPEVAAAALEAIRNELHDRSNGRTSGGPAAYDPATTGVKFEGASNSPDGQYLAYFVETNIHDASLHEAAWQEATCPVCGKQVMEARVPAAGYGVRYNKDNTPHVHPQGEQKKAAKGRYVVRHDKYGDSYHHQTIELARRERDHPETVPAGEWYIWDRIEKRRVDDDETDQHKQAELGEPERGMCPRCGTAQYNPQAGYCPQCGYRKTGSVPDTRTDEWDGTDPLLPFPEPTTFGSLRVEADEDIATTIRGVLKKDDEFGYAVPADLVDALDDGEVKGAWMKLIHSPMPPSYNDMSMGSQHAVRNWARAIVTNILIDRHGRKGYGSQHEAVYPPEGSKVRHASPQAWRRLRDQVTESELRDIAKDIAGHAGGDHESIAHALIHHDWQEGYHQGSLQTVAYPKGRSNYEPGRSRMGEPTPQTHPHKFSDEDVVAEVRHLMALNRDYEATGGNPTDTPNIRRTLAYTKLLRHLSDRKKKRGSLQRMALTDDILTTEATEHCQFPGCTNAPRGSSSYCHVHDVWLQHLRDVNSKLMEITTGILDTNPGMNREAALKLAATTLERFPKLAGPPPDDVVEDMPHTLQRMVQEFQRNHQQQVAQ